MNMGLDTMLAFAGLLGGLITIYVNMRTNAATEKERNTALEKRMDQFQDHMDKLNDKFDKLLTTSFFSKQ